MRITSSVMILSVVIGFPSLCRGGLYNTAEPDEGPLDPNFIKFSETLNVLRSIGADKVEVERALRKRYLLLADLFPKVVDTNKLSAEEKLNFSAVLIRRRKFA